MPLEPPEQRSAPVESDPRLLVCVKRVPDLAVPLTIDESESRIVEDNVVWVMSAYDEYAIELALEVKDVAPGASVTAVSVGTLDSVTTLRQALAMGCDSAILIESDNDVSADTVVAALKAYAWRIAPSVIFCGLASADFGSSYVGPALAEELRWPSMTMVSQMAPVDGGGFEVRRQVDGGHERWLAEAPFVASVVRSTEEPRYPPLPAILKAKRAPVEKLTLSDLGLDATPEPSRVVSIRKQSRRTNPTLLELGDNPRDVAEDLVRRLRSEAGVRW